MIDIIDKDNMFKSISNFPDNIIDAINIGEKIDFKNNYSQINKIIISGMGGSAIGGDIVYALIKNEINIPYFVQRGYDIPKWVDSSTLVICSSYSGNTEETLTVFRKAVIAGAKVIGITTGGTLHQECKKNNFDYVQIPSGLQPRAALAFSFVPLLFLLLNLDKISDKFISILKSSSSSLEKKKNIYSKKIDDNPTWDLAKKIYNTLPIIYADSDQLKSVALRIKGQICENGKILCYHNIFPEMNHNEIVGWENNFDYFNNYSVIWLIDSSLNSRNSARQKIIFDMFNELNISQYTILVTGNTFEERFLSLIYYGDWLSYWIAILHKTDPSPVNKISNLKNKLSNII
mgnify:FL=1